MPSGPYFQMSGDRVLDQVMVDVEFEKTALQAVERQKPAWMTGALQQLRVVERTLPKFTKQKIADQMKANGYTDFSCRRELRAHFKKLKQFPIDPDYRRAIDRYNSEYRRALGDTGLMKLPDCAPPRALTRDSSNFRLPPAASMILPGHMRAPARPDHSALRKRSMDPPSLSYLTNPSTHGAHFPKCKPQYNFFQ